jgi:Fe-S cluster biogenesis protein NfuA
MPILNRAGRRRPPNEVERQIRSELHALVELLAVEHCSMGLSSYDPEGGIAVLRIDAHCPDCAVSGTTFLAGIETRLKLRIVELREVRIESTS